MILRSLSTPSRLRGEDPTLRLGIIHAVWREVIRLESAMLRILNLGSGI